MLLSLHIPYNQYYINSLETLTIACIVLYRTYWFSLIYTEISSNCIAKREILKAIEQILVQIWIHRDCDCHENAVLQN